MDIVDALAALVDAAPVQLWLEPGPGLGSTSCAETVDGEERAIECTESIDRHDVEAVEVGSAERDVGGVRHGKWDGSVETCRGEAGQLAAADERAPEAAVGVEGGAVGTTVEPARVTEHAPGPDRAGGGFVVVREVLG